MATGTQAEPSDHIGKTRKRESELTRKGSTHIDNCNTGFCEKKIAGVVNVVGGGGRVWEAHHIICIAAMEGRKTDDYVENCLWITEWNINDAHNMMGLPVSTEFKKHGTSRADKWVNHKIDHNTSVVGYLPEVRGHLQREVFDTLKQAGDDKDHSFDADDIREELKAVSDHFRAELMARATRHPGVVEGWKNRFDAAYENTWYTPFSMSLTPKKRHPGVSAANLTYLFKSIQ
ncbi:MAG: hypothetical protein AAF970_17565 [Bacteroidota bacterium]